MAEIRVRKGRLSHAALLSLPRVRDWHEAIALRSKLSAAERVRKLGLFCERTGLPPDEVLRLAKEDPDRLASVLIAYARRMQEAGRLDSGTAKVFDAIRAWVRFAGGAFDRFPSLHVVQGASLKAERTPTQEELRRLLSVLSPRGRVAALMMAHAGLRPGTLCNVNGTDGLTLADIPELDPAEGTLARTPFVIEVPERLSKTRLTYRTFGGQELAEALAVYLEERRRQGERLSPASPVIAVAKCAENTPLRRAALARRAKSDRSLFVTGQALTSELREAIGKVVPKGVHWRPYVLRAYCSTQLWQAGNHGRIDRDAREAILGHNLGVAGRYNLAKRLHPDLVEELRAAYARCEGYLSTVPTSQDAQGAVNATRVLLLGLKYTEEELAKLDLEGLTTEALQELVSRKLVPPPAAPTPPTAAPAPSRKHKVVPSKEVAKYLEDGWVPVMKLSGNEVVLSPPVT